MNNKEKILRNLFFGTDTPIESLPITNEKYIIAWRQIDILRDKLGDNEYIRELFKQFDCADDERAFNSFVQGVEVGKLLYSK